MAKSDASEKAKGKSPSVEHDDDIMAPSDAPPEIDPYAVLELATTASADDVKRAYRKKAIVHHPDKVKPEERATAHVKFQEIAFAYAVLSDERRRQRFDATGRTDELGADDDDFNWLDFFRAQFADVATKENIDNFASKYKGSDEERADLLDAYRKHEGRLALIYESVMCSDMLADDDRFRAILQSEIDAGALPAFDSFTNESDGSREKAKEAELKRRQDFDKRQAKKGKARGGGGANDGLDDLAALIRNKNKGRGDDFIANLEAKYAPKAKAKGRAAAPPKKAAPKKAASRKKGKKQALSDDAASASAASPSESASQFEDDESAFSEDNDDDADSDFDDAPASKKKTKAKGRKRASLSDDDDDDDYPASKRRKSAASKASARKKGAARREMPTRRSGRLNK